MKFRFLDFETRDKDGKLPELGASKYTQQDEFTLLCMAAKPYGEEPELWLPGDPWPEWMTNPDPDETWVAHNSNFERLVHRNFLVQRLGFNSVPLNKWLCTMMQCRAMGLPGKLEEAGIALGLDVKKDMEGHRLMMKYTKRRKPTKANPDEFHDDPKELQRVYEYCITDTVVSEQLFDRTKRLTEEELKVWRTNELINDYGFQVDLDSCHKILQVLNVTQERALNELIDLTDGEITSNSPQAYIDYLHRLQLENMKADTVVSALEREDLTEKERRILRIRQVLAQAAVKKFKPFIQKAEADGRMRGTHAYHTASTGRFSSHGIQTQNMKRGWSSTEAIETCLQTMHSCSKTSDAADAMEWAYGDVTDAVSNVVRGMITARPGGWLCPMDFSSIEARVSAWLAGEQGMVDEFEQGVEVYCSFASRLFRRSVTKADYIERFIGKQCILGLSYGLGAMMFYKNTTDLAKKMGLELNIDFDFAKQAVDLYREVYARIPAYWNELEEAAINATLNPGKVYESGQIRWATENYRGYNWLRCKLPSGRIIHYPSPRVFEMWPGYVKPSERTPDNEWKKKATLTFMAVCKGNNRREKRIRIKDEAHFWDKDSDRYNASWQRLSTWGGTLLENVTQGLSRDFLTHSMEQTRAERYQICLHCHDELVADIRYENEVERIRQIMLRRPEWGKTCPIDADGFATKRYRKD